VVEFRFFGTVIYRRAKWDTLCCFFIFFVTSNIVLPKLVGTNYFYWSKHMQPIFITKDLWELVIDGYVMPSTDEFKALSDDDKKSLKELIKKDNEALSLIGVQLKNLYFQESVL
jgi:hypothetical protein